MHFNPLKHILCVSLNALSLAHVHAGVAQQGTEQNMQHVVK